jgi:hypothetical protein
MKKLIILLALSLITGCGSEKAPEKTEAAKAEEKKPLTKIEKLRKKAEFTKAASMVGYDGKQINKDLNKILDAAENQNKDLQKTLNGL